MISKALHIRKIALLAAFVSIGVVLFLFEEFLPRPLPFLKIGLGNIVNLLAIYTLGLTDALTVGVMRVVIGSLVAGKFLSPIFLLSLGGSITSIIGMWCCKFMGKNFVTPFGVSILGAFFHNLTQLLLASIIVVHNYGILYLTPYFCIASIITGGFTGYLVRILLNPVTNSFASFGIK